MNVATHILWHAAGEPTGEGDSIGDCRICGYAGSGLSFSGWVRSTFTDWDKLLPGGIICQPCQFSFCEASTLLSARVGKDKPQRMRNYSHFVINSEWLPMSKGDKARMVEVLRGEFDIAVIAESGQKHIIFRAAPGVVQFEEGQVRDVGVTMALLEPVEALYSVFSKSEIETGRYLQYRIVKFGLEQWYELESEIAVYRGSPAFALAVFLAQKGDPSDDGDAQESGRIAGDGMAGHTTGLQEPVSAHDLAAIRGKCARGSLHQQLGQVYQLDLFETASADQDIG